MTLAAKTAKLRASLVAFLDTLTPDASDAEFRRAYGRWRYFRDRVADEATESGEAREIILDLYKEPAWAKFAVLLGAKRAAYKLTDKYKAKRAARDAHRYETTLKEQRQTDSAKERARAYRQRPDVKVRTAQRRRERRARSRV